MASNPSKIIVSSAAARAAGTNSSGGTSASSSTGHGSCDNGHHLLTTGTITVTTSTPNTQRLRSHTTSDVNFYNSETPTSGFLRTPTTSSSGGGSHHLWNMDLTDLTYVTHMQRVRTRAIFQRQMSNSSERTRRRESIAAVIFPVHLTCSGTGLNFLGASKYSFL